MAAVVTEKIIEMFLILLGGVIVYKAGLIDDKTVPKLSNLLLMFISPLLIFQSYQMEFEMRLFTDCFGHWRHPQSHLRSQSYYQSCYSAKKESVHP